MFLFHRQLISTKKQILSIVTMVCVPEKNGAMPLWIFGSNSFLGLTGWIRGIHSIPGFLHQLEGDLAFPWIWQGGNSSVLQALT